MAQGFWKGPLSELENLGVSPVGELSPVLPSFKMDGKEEETGKERGRGREEGREEKGREGREGRGEEGRAGTRKEKGKTRRW